MYALVVALLSYHRLLFSDRRVQEKDEFGAAKFVIKYVKILIVFRLY